MPRLLDLPDAKGRFPFTYKNAASSDALTNKPAQRALDTGTRTNRSSTYDAASPGQGTWKKKDLGNGALGRTGQVLACSIPWREA